MTKCRWAQPVGIRYWEREVGSAESVLPVASVIVAESRRPLSSFNERTTPHFVIPSVPGFPASRLYQRRRMRLSVKRAAWNPPKLRFLTGNLGEARDLLRLPRVTASVCPSVSALQCAPIPSSIFGVRNHQRGRLDRFATKQTRNRQNSDDVGQRRQQLRRNTRSPQLQ
jgi:hypothetical protein